ncbi:MAG: hypothetical protein PHU29_11535, partial [Sulfuricurvum sp.]|nr:hypothetical protein [Sulfuricurvum sp.]
PIIRFQGDDFIIFRKDNQKPLVDEFYADWLKEINIVVSVSAITLDTESTRDLDTLHSRLAKR